ncbi:AIR carboxylase family protein [Candidatus Micrarchaeota archaeon]|nr:AIR carboxylase family protein [Candidatus Micrarchaeota archaeon]
MMVPIIMGSNSDLEFCKKIGEELGKLGVKYEYRVASAHKATEFALEIVRKYDSENDKVVYITVAGMSNALSAVIDANSPNPVIACPPYSEKFGGMDIISSLRMPSGVCPLVVLEPKNAALAAAKMLGLSDSAIKQKVKEYKSGFVDAIKKADAEVKK